MAKYVECGLLELLDRRWLKIPLEAARRSGPAAQTLAGLLSITSRETFRRVEEIAEESGSNAATVRKHLAKLAADGWIEHLGRQPTRRGRARRTVTFRIMSETKAALAEEYAFLPGAFCGCVANLKPTPGVLPWSSRLLLSVVMSKLAALKAAVIEQNGCGLDEDDLAGSIDNMGGEGRFRFPLKQLVDKTGMSRETIVEAKRNLYRNKIIVWYRGQGPSDGDLLAPNGNFRIRNTPLDAEYVRREFVVVKDAVLRGSDSGHRTQSDSGHRGGRKVVIALIFNSLSSSI